MTALTYNGIGGWLPWFMLTVQALIAVVLVAWLLALIFRPGDHD